jgi:hypothetical protein
VSTSFVFTKLGQVLAETLLLLHFPDVISYFTWSHKLGILPCQDLKRLLFVPLWRLPFFEHPILTKVHSSAYLDSCNRWILFHILHVCCFFLEHLGSSLILLINRRSSINFLHVIREVLFNCTFRIIIIFVFILF